MTSSSAYSNVLLKPSVQSQPAAAPKRDYQDDFSNADFSQTYKDVRETERDEKVAKPVAKKAAPVQDRDKPREIAREKKPVDSDKVASKNDSAEDASVKEKQSKSADETLDPSTVAPANLQQPLAPEQTTTNKLGISLGGLATDAEKSTDAVTVDGLALTPGAEASQNTLGDTALSTDSAATLLSSGDKTESKLDTDSTKDAALLPSASTADAQQAAADLAAQQAAQQNAATGVKSPIASDVAATSAETLSAVVGDVVSEKAASKTVADDKNSITTSEPDAEAAPIQSSDSKSVFEKMLQTVARSSAPAQEDKVAATPAQNTSNTGSTALDSLARFSDTQTPAARSFVAQTAVPVPVGQPQWSQAVGEKVLWLAAQNISSAEINLHPKDLGPMQVRVSVNQEQTTVSFTSHHPVVREVLDQNLNRLRDMFSEQGLNLVNVDVSDKSFSRQQGDAKDQKGQGGTNSATPEEETLVAVTNIVQQRLVDHYA
ncbi:MAG: flagellar hook-length control protein FliK [Gammaproteobacteria bacterium]|nr:MAG: flagellar hook-length control protein FliK [Gammaproteobacteria bacterium]